MRILRVKADHMRELADRAAAWDMTEGNLSGFLRSQTGAVKVVAGKEEYPVPRFYGIPKIHKYPVKFRPIIPCHSVVFNPAAKFISKKA